MARHSDVWQLQYPDRLDLPNGLISAPSIKTLLRNSFQFSSSFTVLGSSASTDSPGVRKGVVMSSATKPASPACQWRQSTANVIWMHAPQIYATLSATRPMESHVSFRSAKAKRFRHASRAGYPCRVLQTRESGSVR